MLRTVGPGGEVGQPEHQLTALNVAYWHAVYKIGRVSDNDLVLDHEDFPLLISRYHAR